MIKPVFDAKLLLDSCQTIGVSLNTDQLEQFEIYFYELLEWNKTTNLTRISASDIISLHFVDSLLAYSLIPVNAVKILDLGSGAGFPGVPIRIVRPDCQLTLIDSGIKRITFLKHLCQKINLIDVDVFHGRAEELARDGRLRASFDLITARAFAELTVLAEMSSPYLKINGLLLALKSISSVAETNSANSAFQKLNLELLNVTHKQIPLTDIERSFIVLKQIKICPEGFPRPFKKIKHNPL